MRATVCFIEEACYVLTIPYSPVFFFTLTTFFQEKLLFSQLGFDLVLCTFCWVLIIVSAFFPFVLFYFFNLYPYLVMCSLEFNEKLILEKKHLL